MFWIKICFLEPEPVGAEFFQVETEPKYFTRSRSRKKNIWSRSRVKLFRLRNTAEMKTISSCKKKTYQDWITEKIIAFWTGESVCNANIPRIRNRLQEYVRAGTGTRGDKEVSHPVKWVVYFLQWYGTLYFSKWFITVYGVNGTGAYR